MMNNTSTHRRPFTPNLSNRVAICTGGSRGIGRAVCLALAQQGCAVVVAAKTTEPDPKLPGTIHTVVAEIRAKGGRAIPFQLDVQNEQQCKACVKAAVDTFGSIDIIINNASALWWKSIPETPMQRFDLMFRVNARGSFALTQAALPYMEKNGWGHVITMSPPIDDTLEGLESRVAYSITKIGMTIVALGVAVEYRDKGIAGNALWPITLVESSAVENFVMGTPDMWRKADILADAVLCLLSQDPKTCTGKAWLDEELLRTYGVEDFTQYRYNPVVEPPTMRELAGKDKKIFNRGKALKSSGSLSKL
jgi:citronellol/citronellal dehydrogenase